MTPFTSRERLLAAVVLGGAIATQLYWSLFALWKAPAFVQLFAGLGGELPLSTRAFLATRAFWWLIPFGFGALSFDLLRRREPSGLHFGGVVIAAAVVALLMHAFLVEALYAPLFGILEKIG